MNEFSETHYKAKYHDYQQGPVTEVTLWNQDRNRPHGRVDGRLKPPNP